MQTLGKFFVPAMFALASAVALAAPVTVSVPYFNLENRANNSLGFAPGERVRFGANSVVPNGDGGTTAVATRNSDGLARTVFFDPFPLGLNWFGRMLNDNPALYRGAWTLRFTNGGDVANVPIYLDPAAQQAPFVQSITISGSSLTPTFAWSPPAGASVNAYRVNIYDKSIASGNIVSRNLLPTQTSYTLDPAHFTLANYRFDPTHQYSIEISLIQTKDGSTNASNSNLQAIARAYADFTPTQSGGPVVNLPVLLNNGAYQFNMTVQAGQTYFIDPIVAVGYDYEIGQGNPLFSTVDLPDNIGDGIYDIYGFDGNDQPTLLTANWSGANVYSFAGNGLSKFRVLGIETSAGLDPANTTAFITGLTFASSGQFTGTQTPITVDTGTVPVPSTLALAGLALLTLVWRRPGALT